MQTGSPGSRLHRPPRRRNCARGWAIRSTRAKWWPSWAAGKSWRPRVTTSRTHSRASCISSRANKEKADGKSVFIRPLLDKETRSARVVAEIANPDGVWRPGSFVTAAIAIEEQPVPVAVPSSAIQTIGGEKVVFVRTPEGFEKRAVVVGRGDERLTEIVSGLKPGEIVAATN